MDEDLEYGAIDSPMGDSAAAPQNRYESRLPLRVDISAALTYCLGSISGIFFLIAETQNDYVRYHAWQSSIVFTMGLFLHLFFMLIGSGVLGWLLFVLELIAAGFLAFKAYEGGMTLERFQLPLFGAVAARWTDSE